MESWHFVLTLMDLALISVSVQVGLSTASMPMDGTAKVVVLKFSVTWELRGVMSLMQVMLIVLNKGLGKEGGEESFL